MKQSIRSGGVFAIKGYLLGFTVLSTAGLLPKPLKLRLWGKKSADEGLDNAKRFLHITATALVLEVEGEQEVYTACVNY